VVALTCNLYLLPEISAPESPQYPIAFADRQQDRIHDAVHPCEHFAILPLEVLDSSSLTQPALARGCHQSKNLFLKLILPTL
jgi:hypothetical protein